MVLNDIEAQIGVLNDTDRHQADTPRHFPSGRRPSHERMEMLIQAQHGRPVTQLDEAKRGSADSQRLALEQHCTSRAAADLLASTDNAPEDHSIRGAQRSTPITGHLLSSTAQHDMVRLRMRAILRHFGCDEKTTSSWPGVSNYCAWVEQHCSRHFEERSTIVERILGLARTSSPALCWLWYMAVIDGFELSEDVNVSVDTVLNRILKPNTHLSDHDRREAQLLIYTVLCWTSITLRPILPAAESSVEATVTVSLRFEGLTQDLPMSSSMRPAIKLFKTLRTARAQPMNNLDKSIANAEFGSNTAPARAFESEILYTSGINYFMLSRIGRVKIQWVKTLDKHLTFDAIKGSGQPRIIEQLAAILLANIPISDGTALDIKETYREILFSYRILFEDAASRRAITDALNDLRKNSNGVDPLLVSLCTARTHRPFWQPWINTTVFDTDIFPPSQIGADGLLCKSNVYHAEEDFPVLGMRLSRLQRHSLRQQPSRVRDLWRDRRNPLQWYTFWAVLWVGGATIVLAIFSVLIAAAQLFFAVRPQSMS